jgi:hypothetical protein
MIPTQTCKFAFEGFNQPNMGLEARKKWGAGRNNGVCRTAAWIKREIGLEHTQTRETEQTLQHWNRHNYYDEHHYRSHIFSLLLRFLFSLLIRSPLFQRLK